MLLPRHLANFEKTVTADPEMSEGVEAMLGRAEDFRSSRAAFLAGVAVHPPSVDFFNEFLEEELWGGDRKTPARTDEVVVGAGLHAAIYCSVRVALGFPRPVVLEARERVGGTFAVSLKPSFYLNSRNRPGRLSVPGEPSGSLNYLPGADLQPSDLSGSEYQVNSDMAFVVRAQLAMHADVFRSRRVTGIEGVTSPKTRSRSYRVFVSGQAPLSADRVVLAPGPGKPREFLPGAPQTSTFEEFMASMDRPFPLQGMERVAVVGASDGGRTAVEALTGQGPAAHWSVASVDRPRDIDWYGCAQPTRAEWENCNRSRYKSLGRVLPKEAGQRSIVRPLAKNVATVTQGYEQVFVDGRPYDRVLVCTGYDPQFFSMTGSLALVEPSPYAIGGRPCARKYGSERVFVVGPAAQIDVDTAERQASPGLVNVPENSTALFRYAERTAALAMSLP